MTIEKVEEYKLPCLAFLEITSITLSVFSNPALGNGGLLINIGCSQQPVSDSTQEHLKPWFSIFPGQMSCFSFLFFFTQVSQKCNSKHILKTPGYLTHNILGPVKTH